VGPRRAISVALRVELGASFEGTIVAGRESLALEPTSPRNGVSGFGRNRPSPVVANLRNFASWVICCATDVAENAAHRVAAHWIKSFGFMLMTVEFGLHYDAFAGMSYWPLVLQPLRPSFSGITDSICNPLFSL